MCHKFSHSIFVTQALGLPPDVLYHVVGLIVVRVPIVVICDLSAH